MINGIIKTEQAVHAMLPLPAAVASCFRFSARSVLSVTGLALVLASPGLAHAATFQVLNTNDDGPGSLRQAVLDANTNTGADKIVFDATVSGKLALVSGALPVVDSVTVTGPGAGLLTLDAGGSSEIFAVSDSPSVSAIELNISGLTLTNATTAISANVGSVEPVLTVVDSTLSGNLESAILMSNKNSKGSLTVRRSQLFDNGGNAIHFSSGYSTPEIRAVMEEVTISGNGGAGVYCGPNVTAELSESEIKANESNGIILGESGRLALTNSSVVDNGANGIQALANYVHADIRSSTISGNQSDGVDIGIYSFYDSHEFGSFRSSLIIANSTISNNVDGAGVRFESDSGSASIMTSTITGNAFGGFYADAVYDHRAIEIENSVVAGNGERDLRGRIPFSVRHSLILDTAGADIVEPVPDSNIFGMDPLLGPLQNNGGSTLTHALHKSSPAIDRGDNVTCSKTDQRGVVRPQDGNGDNLATCDMGAYERERERAAGAGIIGDRVWLDEDADGVQDAEEKGFAGVEVRLRVGCDPGAILTTLTDDTGAYSFAGLASGDYQLEFIKPAGFEFSPAIAAGNYRIDSNADPATGLDQCRSFKAGQRRLALDAGLISGSINIGSAAIGDLVWQDDNGDGVRDSNEQGLEGVTVNLRMNCDPARLQSTTTDSNGAYRFGGLISGSYQLEFVAPGGYTFSPMIAAGNYRMDSNADPATGLDECRSIEDGQSRLGLDAGLIP